MSDRLFKPIGKVSVWRENIPAASTVFGTKPLSPGEQLDITDLRIKFRVDRSLTRTPNQCDIYISNLTKPTRHDLKTLPLSVQLEAGYDGVARLMFRGDLHFGMSEQKGPTWETLLQCGDGDRAYNYARCNRSYKPGTTVKTIVRDAARSMGLMLPKNVEADTDLDVQALTGATSWGQARDELTRLLAPYGYHWSIQNGVLRVLRDDEVSSLSALPIDAAHGMIGSPEYGTPPRSGKPPHIRVKMQIYPELTPGDLVQVTSEETNGVFRLEKVRHQGDTHVVNEWFTDVEILPV